MPIFCHGDYCQAVSLVYDACYKHGIVLDDTTFPFSLMVDTCTLEIGLSRDEATNMLELKAFGPTRQLASYLASIGGKMDRKTYLWKGMYLEQLDNLLDVCIDSGLKVAPFTDESDAINPWALSMRWDRDPRDDLEDYYECKVMVQRDQRASSTTNIAPRPNPEFRDIPPLLHDFVPQPEPCSSSGGPRAAGSSSGGDSSSTAPGSSSGGAPASSSGGGSSSTAPGSSFTRSAPKTVSTASASESVILAPKSIFDDFFYFG
jgi:hypothetical protein